MQVGVLEALSRYPVKSMGGERLDAVEIGVGGIPGDRAWAVRDEVRGGIRGAKKIPALMGLRARHTAPPSPVGSSAVEITLGRDLVVGQGAAQPQVHLGRLVAHPGDHLLVVPVHVDVGRHGGGAELEQARVVDRPAP
jgi:hypothetical protein